MGNSTSKQQNLKKLYQITIHHNLFLTSMQVILAPYYCLFCVLSNDKMNVPIDTYLRRYMHQHQGHKKKYARKKLHNP